MLPHLIETGSRLRGRIERVLDAAKAQGLRSGENPARWRGHLDQLLRKRHQLARGHYTAMGYVDLPQFMMDLRLQPAVAAPALEFLILTAARAGEVVGARWEEFDLERAVWTVPPKRMKGGREHRGPLSLPALTIVKELSEHRPGDFVFAGRKRGKPFATRTLWWLIQSMKIEHATVHGFRSTFRDWAAECTDFSHEVCEAALAHTIRNKVEAAYRRGDMFEKRRRLMQLWAAFCTASSAQQAGNVTVFPMFAFS
jgi:integrase